MKVININLNKLEFSLFIIRAWIIWKYLHLFYKKFIKKWIIKTNIKEKKIIKEKWKLKKNSEIKWIDILKSGFGNINNRNTKFLVNSDLSDWNYSIRQKSYILFTSDFEINIKCSK